MKKIDRSMLIFSFIILCFYGVVYTFTGIGIPCFFHKITNLYCPGCGISRMFISILKFDFYQAFRFNPLIFVMLILSIIYFIIKFIYRFIIKKEVKLPNSITYIILVVVIVYWVIRNLPYFDYLIPTIVN